MGEIKTGSWLSPLKLCILQWFQNKSMILTISILYKTSAYKCIPIGDSRVSIDSSSYWGDITESSTSILCCIHRVGNGIKIIIIALPLVFLQ